MRDQRSGYGLVQQGPNASLYFRRSAMQEELVIGKSNKLAFHFT